MTTQKIFWRIVKFITNPNTDADEDVAENELDAPILMKIVPQLIFYLVRIMMWAVLSLYSFG